MIRVYLFIFAIMMISGTANAQKRFIDVTTEPKGAKAKVYKIDENYDFKYLAKCKTPCKLKFKPGKVDGFIYYITFRKKYYVSERDLEINLDESVLKVHQVLLSEEVATTRSRVKAEATDKTLKAFNEASRLEDLAKVIAKIENCRTQISNDTFLNRDIIPCHRLPPFMPFAFTQQDYSGYCAAKFDVLPSGDTDNIKLACTDAVLENAAEKTLQDWIYLPKRISGQSVKKFGAEAKVHFITKDERGRRNPLPPGY